MYKNTYKKIYCKGADSFEFNFIFLFNETFSTKGTTDTFTKKQEHLEIQWKTLIMIVLEMNQS